MTPRTREQGHEGGGGEGAASDQAIAGVRHTPRRQVSEWKGVSVRRLLVILLGVFRRGCDGGGRECCSAGFGQVGGWVCRVDGGEDEELRLCRQLGPFSRCTRRRR